MSDLRKQLEAAAKEYRATQYPGDLANDLLNLEPSTRRSFWALFPLGLAAAAAIAVGAWVFRSMPEQNIEVAIVPQETEIEEVPEVSLGSVEVPSFTELSFEGIDLAPAVPDWSFSAPSFSMQEIEFTEEQDGSTTQEAV